MATANVHINIAQYMAFFSATIHTAQDGASQNPDCGILYIGSRIEGNIRISFTTAKHVTHFRIIHYIFQRTHISNCTILNGDFSISNDITQLRTAIHV